VTWSEALALLLCGAGVLSALLGFALTRELRAALPMTLELWMAAGLLRLSGEPSSRQILSVAVIVAVRKLVVSALRGSARRAAGP
jgi:hypothetical protein